MAAEVHFRGRGEPAQVVTALADGREERCFSQPVLEGDFLQYVVRGPLC